MCEICDYHSRPNVRGTTKTQVRAPKLMKSSCAETGGTRAALREQLSCLI